MKKIKSMSNIYPQLGHDTTSSKTTVYFRENATEQIVPSEFEGEEDYVIYVWDETHYTLDEYEKVLLEQQLEKQEEDILNNALATVELYETISVTNEAIKHVSNLSLAPLYAKLVDKGLRNIDEVPLGIKDMVENILKEM